MFSRVQCLRFRNEQRGVIAPDAPVSPFIRLSEGWKVHGRAKPEVVEFLAMSAEAHYDIAQALPLRQLPEDQRQKLFPTGEALDPVRAPIARHALVELITNDPVHDLGKDVFSLVHSECSEGIIPRLSHVPNSSRKIRFSQIVAN